MSRFRLSAAAPKPIAPPPQPAHPPAAQRPDLPSPAQPLNMLDIKLRLHARLIDEIDLAKLSTLDEGEMRRQVSNLVGDFVKTERLALTSQEISDLGDSVFDEMVGLGPIEPLLKDDGIADILINGPFQVYIERGGQLELTPVRFRDNDHLLRIVNRIVAGVGRRIDESQPMVDARLADGSRVNAAIAPITIDGACVSIRKDMPLDRAALIGCGVMTGVGAVFHTSNVRPGDTVAVIGCGGVGLAAINGAAIAGASRIIAIDMSPSKDNLARHFGATDFICAADTDPVAAVQQLTKGGVDHSFEAVGLKKTSEQAFLMTGRGGTANIIGMIPIGQTVEVPGFMFLGERRLQGSMMGSNRFPVDMPRLVDFYLSGKLKLDDLISRRIALKDVNEAFEEMKTGQVARSVIMFDA